VVGSGPAGGAVALMLASYGVPHIVVTKYGRLADTPRALVRHWSGSAVVSDRFGHGGARGSRSAIATTSVKLPVGGAGLPATSVQLR